MPTDRVARAEALLERVREDAVLAGAIKAAQDAAALRDVLADAGYGDVEPDDVVQAARIPQPQTGSDELTDPQLERVVGGAAAVPMSAAAQSHLMQLILLGLGSAGGGG
jgi:predicted ribosomally synthesized peptide with nif11-like leader